MGIENVLSFDEQKYGLFRVDWLLLNLLNLGKPKPSQKPKPNHLFV